jgi:hypothetical protein
MTIVLLDKIVPQESGIPQWLSWLPRDGGYRSVQSALWKRLNDYINRYDQFVSDSPTTAYTHTMLESLTMYVNAEIMHTPM